MPLSDPLNRERFVSELQKYECQSVIELGIGIGEVGNYLRQHLPELKLYGVEVWDEYAGSDWTAYNTVYVMDIRKAVNILPKTDAVIWADVLEHFDRDEALSLWQKSHNLASKILLLSIPIFGLEQGTYNGNPFECHRSFWTEKECVETLGGTLVAKNETVGIFVKQIYE